MKLASIPHNEAERILAVHSLGLLDTEPEERFDRVTRIIKLVFNIPYAFITLVDENRVWMKSKQGSEVVYVPRELSFCGHAICSDVMDKYESRIFEVIDTTQDSRFLDNPYVTGTPPIKYYIGFVLQSSDHQNVGTLCMEDTRRRHLTSHEKGIFSEFGLIVESELNKIIENTHKDMSEYSNDLQPSKNDINNIEDFVKSADYFKNAIKEINNLLNALGITFLEWRILREIIQNKNTTPTDITIATSQSRPKITQQLSLLEAKGLISRHHQNGGDKRLVILKDTSSGEEIWKQGTNIIIGRINDIINSRKNSSHVSVN